MKKIFIFFLFLIIVSCNNMNTKLEKLLNNVIESSNKEMEFENVKKLTKYMSNKGLSFSMTLTDNNANNYKLPNDFPIDNVFVKKVYIAVCDGDKKVFESDSWEPKSKENIYMFFYE